MKILHISDIHIGIPIREVPVTSWLSKRALGGLNLLMGRGKHFADARRKVAALPALAEREQVDLVICTGDYTGLGLEREFVEARRAVAPLMKAGRGFITVPGNHDLYVREPVRKGWFEHHFKNTLTTDLPMYQGAEGWPRVRLFDEGLAVVTVNSSRPNTFWRSSGKVPVAQLQALREALRDSEVRDHFVLVVTHYAPCLEEGVPDRPLHCLVNVDEFLEVVKEVRRGALLCGHVHRRFHAHPPGCELPVFCAGSTTKDEREGLWLFEFEQGRLRAIPGFWKDDGYQLDRDAVIEV